MHGVGDRFGDCKQLIEIARRHSLKIDHDASVSARVDESRNRSRGHSRHLGVLAESTDYLGMKTSPEIRRDQCHRARRYGGLLPNAVRINLQGAKARCIECDPTGNDPLEARPVLIDGRFAIPVPGSGEAPVRRLNAWLRRKMRAGGYQEREANLAQSATIQQTPAP